MSNTTEFLSHPFFFFPGHAVSPEAKSLDSMWEEISNHLLETEVLGGSRRELQSLADECSTDDWDGYGAQAIEDLTLGEAERFLLLLPAVFSSPSVSCEPDGEIEFEWYESPRRVVSVSVGPDSILKWAAIFGAEEAWGALPFPDEIPERLLNELRRLA